MMNNVMQIMGHGWLIKLNKHIYYVLNRQIVQKKKLSVILY